MWGISLPANGSIGGLPGIMVFRSWPVIMYTVRNQVVSGSLEPAKIVPAVTGVWRAQAPHCKDGGS